MTSATNYRLMFISLLSLLRFPTNLDKEFSVNRTDDFSKRMMIETITDDKTSSLQPTSDLQSVFSKVVSTNGDNTSRLTCKIYLEDLPVRLKQLQG